MRTRTGSHDTLEAVIIVIVHTFAHVQNNHVLQPWSSFEKFFFAI